MIIEIYYFINDCGDGSASLRVYANKEKAKIDFDAAASLDATHHLNDYELKTMQINTSDFDVAKTPTLTYKQYNTDKPSNFDVWYNSIEWDVGDRDGWEYEWNKLYDLGVLDPRPVIQGIVDLMRNEYGD